MSYNVDITFGVPEDGKVKFTAGPKDTGAKTFFMKVRVKRARRGRRVCGARV